MNVSKARDLETQSPKGITTRGGVGHADRRCGPLSLKQEHTGRATVATLRGDDVGDHYGVAHTLEIFARGPDFESDALSLLSRNPSRLSRPPSRLDAARLRFQPPTLTCSRWLPPPVLAWRTFAWVPEELFIAWWIASRVLSHTCGRPPCCVWRHESFPLFPRPRPPPSISISPSRSSRVGPRFRIPPRSAALGRPLEFFAVLMLLEYVSSTETIRGKRRKGHPGVTGKEWRQMRASQKLTDDFRHASKGVRDKGEIQKKKRREWMTWKCCRQTQRGRIDDGE